MNETTLTFLFYISFTKFLKLFYENKKRSNVSLTIFVKQLNVYIILYFKNKMLSIYKIKKYNLNC